MLSHRREPDWLGCITPLERAARKRRAAIVHARIGERGRRRTIILKEEADTYEGFPGLSRTTPFATISEAG